MVVIEEIYNQIQYEIATAKPALDDDQGRGSSSSGTKTVYDKEQGGFVKGGDEGPGARAREFAKRESRPAMTTKDLRAIAARLAKEQEDG